MYASDGSSGDIIHYSCGFSLLATNVLSTFHQSKIFVRGNLICDDKIETIFRNSYITIQIYNEIGDYMKQKFYNTCPLL